MARNRIGQLITFSIERDEDQDFRSWIWVNVKRGDTVASTAARRGRPDQARRIADENGIRSVNSKFSGRGKKRLKVPGKLRAALTFDVLAGDQPPTVVDGYARFSMLDRPERTGLTTFDGYNPIVMEVPIRFEAARGDSGGVDVENDIQLLERMAGRGNFEGAAVGEPAIVRLSTTNGARVVPLLSRNYQWSLQNKTGPLWRISDIAWDKGAGSGVLRNHAGNRVRQLAVVTVQQHTHLSLQPRSVTARAKRKKKARRK